MSGVRTILASGAAVGAIGIGCVLWVMMLPGEDRKRQMMQNLPEANGARLDETRRRNAVLLQAIKEAAETNDNVARRF